MSKIFSMKDELDKIRKSFWVLTYVRYDIELSDDYLIFVNKNDKGFIWFEVYHVDSWEGCYLFSSQDLKEVFDWCYDNLNLDILYY